MLPLLHSRLLILGFGLLVLATTSVLAGAVPKTAAAANPNGVAQTKMPHHGTQKGQVLSRGSHDEHQDMSGKVELGKPAGGTPSAAAAALPTEPGQGAFATIAEIVGLLTRDPKTNWSKVNIDRLREHLVDMDEVTLRAKVSTAVFPDRIEFTITATATATATGTGTGRTLQAIQAMVPAHSAVLSRSTAWNVKAVLTPRGAVMSLSSQAPQALPVIKALGFFGVMATGAHHQAHHLAMAKGDSLAHAHN